MSQQLFKVYLQSLQHTFKDLPIGNFYWRFHKRDLNRIITIPCPVDSHTQQTEIKEFKELRAQIGIKEDFICPQCPHHAKCEQAFKQPDAGNMQTLNLKYFSKFLETVSTHQLNIKTPSDDRSYWLASSRVLDTFHAVLIDFQLNQNKHNEIFLTDMANVTDEPIQTPRPKRTEKYIKQADFIDEQSTGSEKRSRKFTSNDENEEGNNRFEKKWKNKDYSSDRQDRGNRYERRDDFRGDRGDRQDRPNRYSRSEGDNKFERNDDRFNGRRQRREPMNEDLGSDQQYEEKRREKYGDRNDRYNKSDRQDRFQRQDRNDRYDRQDRYNKTDRYDKSERSERFDKTERFDKPDRADRQDRFIKSDQNERIERYNKFDKGDRQDKFDRGNRQDRFQKRDKQQTNNDESLEDFSEFVKQREQHLKQKVDGNENQTQQKQVNENSQQQNQESNQTQNENNDGGVEISSGRKIRKNMKFRVAQ